LLFFLSFPQTPKRRYKRRLGLWRERKDSKGERSVPWRFHFPFPRPPGEVKRFLSLFSWSFLFPKIGSILIFSTGAREENPARPEKEKIKKEEAWPGRLKPERQAESLVRVAQEGFNLRDQLYTLTGWSLD